MATVPLRLGDQTLVVQEPGWVTDHGAAVADWSEPAEEYRVPGCLLQPLEGAESDAHRRAEQSLYRAWLPAGSPITATSRVRAEDAPDDAWLAVVGQPLRWEGRGFPLPHVEVRLAAWEG